MDEDKELFNTAIEPQPRDEAGRFAPKEPQEPTPEAQADPQPEPQPQPEPVVQAVAPQVAPKEPEPQGIPPWRLKEEADNRRAAEARAQELERRIAQFEQQNRQPEKVPDLYEDPNAFVAHGIRTELDPVKQAQRQTTEFWSRKFAVQAHGAEKVKAAYDALDQALRSRQPDAVAVYQNAMNSLDPFGDIVEWHQQKAVYSQVGSDPNAWFEKQLEERLKDPSHQAKLMERIRGQVQPSQRPVTQLPPSLNKVTSAAPLDDGGEDTSDGGLLKSALRR